MAVLIFGVSDLLTLNIIAYSVSTVYMLALLGKFLRRDFDALFPVCREVTQEYADTRSLAVRGWDCVLRLFSPLM